jgi:SAM-dependent methyltransferase
MAALEARHRKDLTFPEIRHALQALSSLYVERRQGIARDALDGRGKRAAFALYYSALHYLLVRRTVAALGAALPPPKWILDLGCGTGVGGAAWAAEASGLPNVQGVEARAWAAEEARWTLRALGIKGRVVQGDLRSARFPDGRGAVLLSYTLNELDDGDRTRLLDRILDSPRGTLRILVVEPLSRRVNPWWPKWEQVFRDEGGRQDEWRFASALPEAVELLGRAAGLDPALTGRSLYLPQRP